MVDEDRIICQSLVPLLSFLWYSLPVLRNMSSLLTIGPSLKYSTVPYLDLEVLNGTK